MALLSNVLGFSALGLAARLGQLSIQKKNPFTNPGGHLISMAAFGLIGYGAYQWDVRAAELLGDKRKQILENRAKLEA